MIQFTFWYVSHETLINCTNCIHNLINLYHNHYIVILHKNNGDILCILHIEILRCNDIIKSTNETKPFIKRSFSVYQFQTSNIINKYKK